MHTVDPVWLQQRLTGHLVCWIFLGIDMSTAMDHYAVVGQNNRNLLVQSKKLAPFHEDITRRDPFHPASVSPGEYTRIKLDFKHSNDREMILNDIRLRFNLDFSERTSTGHVLCVRGTDLIREFVVKINEDVVFKVDRQLELTHLWLMNNHRHGGETEEVNNSFLMNYGVIPSGWSPPLYSHSTDNTDKKWYTATTPSHVQTIDVTAATRPGLERHDGLPRLIYSDVDTTNKYKFMFDMSLNQLCGPIFHRLHLRRVEYIQIELRFEPWVNTTETEKFLLFMNDPTTGGDHPYSKAKFSNLEIRQYRTTLLDNVNGFTLPPTKMLSWLMHRFSRREYDFNFTDKTYIDIQLHDWEIRSNIVRVWWMLKPLHTRSGRNGFCPYAAPCEGYDQLYGVEVRWKNDKVLDLDTVFQVYRHYSLSENKRYSLQDPHHRFQRLFKKDSNARTVDARKTDYKWDEQARSINTIGEEVYEVPIYHVDLSMNIQNAIPGAELIGGIVNDTSDYVIRIKQIKLDEKESKDSAFEHSGARNLWVFIEYQTLVNLSAGSNQFQRGSQVVTKQLNVQ